MWTYLPDSGLSVNLDNALEIYWDIKNSEGDYCTLITWSELNSNDGQLCTEIKNVTDRVILRLALVGDNWKPEEPEAIQESDEVSQS